MPLLTAENLQKTYVTGEARVTALAGVSLSVEPGDFVALMGPSGCGKSTLLHLCGAMDRPSGGTLRLNDRDLSAMEVRPGGELECQGVLGQERRRRLRQKARDGDRPLPDRVQDAPIPGLRDLLEIDGRPRGRRGRAHLGGSRSSRGIRRGRSVRGRRAGRRCRRG